MTKLYEIIVSIFGVIAFAGALFFTGRKSGQKLANQKLKAVSEQEIAKLSQEKAETQKEKEETAIEKTLIEKTVEIMSKKPEKQPDIEITEKSSSEEIMAAINQIIKKAKDRK